MRRIRLRLAAITALAVAATALVATNVGGASSGGSDKKPIIGFVVHVKGDPFIQQIIDGAMAAGKTGFTRFRGVQLVDRAGHWPMEEQPEIVSRQLLDFLKSEV